MSNSTVTKESLPIPLVQVRQKAQITLPRKARRVLGIKEGDYLEVKLEDNRLVLQPKTVFDKFPEVELSAEGKKLLSEALEDVKKGRVKKFGDVKDLIKSLHQ